MSIEVGDLDLRTPAECYVERARVELTQPNLRANLAVYRCQNRGLRGLRGF